VTTGREIGVFASFSEKTLAAPGAEKRTGKVKENVGYV
jgi:hypothetical protein